MPIMRACTTATPYQPVTPQSRFGFQDQQIEANRVRVTFKGNSLTSRQTVEDYMLFHAAELTLQKGFDYFVADGRATDAHRREVSSPTYTPMYPGPYWRPYWRAYYRGVWGDPFYGSEVETREITQFEANAEIIMFKGPKPTDNGSAFDAREVVANLKGRIQYPEPAKK